MKNEKRFKERGIQKVMELVEEWRKIHREEYLFTVMLSQRCIVCKLIKIWKYRVFIVRCLKH